MCGNHCGNCLWVDDIEGSPPRVREPPGHDVPDFKRLGITPACAGTTIHSVGAAAGRQDHPRVCGNHTM